MTQTVEQLKHAQLVEIAKKWLQKKHSIVISEMATSGEEPDAIGWRGRTSTLVECKASISDFKADAQKYFRCHPEMGIGQYRYFCAPVGLIKLESLPERWGLIECNGESVREVRKAELFDVYDLRSEIGILISTIRRIGQTAPKGVSIKYYTFETQNRATLGIDLNPTPTPTLASGFEPSSPASCTDA